jgi:hypothetical protein
LSGILSSVPLLFGLEHSRESRGLPAFTSVHVGHAHSVYPEGLLPFRTQTTRPRRFAYPEGIMSVSPRLRRGVPGAELPGGTEIIPVFSTLKGLLLHLSFSSALLSADFVNSCRNFHAVLSRIGVYRCSSVVTILFGCGYAALGKSASSAGDNVFGYARRGAFLQPKRMSVVAS